MRERWALDGEDGWLDAAAAVDLITHRLRSGFLTTYFESNRGRLIAFVSNGQRAEVVLMSGEGDPGEHAADLDAIGVSGGFVLENGQVDEIDNIDTVPISQALRILQHLVTDGCPPSDVAWRVDR